MHLISDMRDLVGSLLLSVYGGLYGTDLNFSCVYSGSEDNSDIIYDLDYPV